MAGIDRATGPRQTTAAFVAVTTLFFAWGFITAMIDPLIPSVRAIFHLTYAQSMLTQFAFFMAYGIVSLPEPPSWRDWATGERSCTRSWQ